MQRFEETAPDSNWVKNDLKEYLEKENIYKYKEDVLDRVLQAYIDKHNGENIYGSYRGYYTFVKSELLTNYKELLQ